MTDEAQQSVGAIEDPLPEQPTLQAEPSQIYTGLAIGTPERVAHCTACSTRLHEGAYVTVYAYRCAESVRWDLARCYCRGCGPTEIGTPTLGAGEILVRGWVGKFARRHSKSRRLCLTAVETIAYSPPDAGCAP